MSLAAAQLVQHKRQGADPAEGASVADLDRLTLHVIEPNAERRMRVACCSQRLRSRGTCRLGNMQTHTSNHCNLCRATSFQERRPLLRQHSVRRPTVLVRAAAETKASDFRRLRIEEIDQHVEDAKRELFMAYRVLSRSAGQGNQVCIQTADPCANVVNTVFYCCVVI